MGLDFFPQPVAGQCRDGVSDSEAAITEDPMRLMPGSRRFGSEALVDGFSGPSLGQSARFARVTRGEGYRDDVSLPPSDGPGAATGGGLGRIFRPIGNFFKAIGKGLLSLIGIETGSQPSTASSRTVGLVDPGEVSTGGGIVIDSRIRQAANSRVAQENVRVFHTGAFNLPVIIRRPVQVAQPAVTAVRPRIFCGIP